MAFDRVQTLCKTVSLDTSILRCGWIYCCAEKWSLRRTRSNLLLLRWYLLLIRHSMPHSLWSMTSNGKILKYSQPGALSYCRRSIASAEAFWILKVSIGEGLSLVIRKSGSVDRQFLIADRGRSPQYVIGFLIFWSCPCFTISSILEDAMPWDAIHWNLKFVVQGNSGVWFSLYSKSVGYNDDQIVFYHKRRGIYLKLNVANITLRLSGSCFALRSCTKIQDPKLVTAIM